MKTTKEIETLISSIGKCKDNFILPKDRTTEEAESNFKDIIRRRLDHCSKALEDNLQDAETSASGQIVDWGNGHFSFPVYKELVAALDLHYNQWNALIWQQIIRQMYNESNSDSYLFYFATEMLLCKTQQY